MISDKVHAAIAAADQARGVPRHEPGAEDTAAATREHNADAQRVWDQAFKDAKTSPSPRHTRSV